jgi:hypothetical protein
MVRYTKPGTYVAICNTMNFDGHYTKIFEYPQNFIDDTSKLFPGFGAPDVAWYFLNRVDTVACLEAIYPIEIFHSVVDHHFETHVKSRRWNAAPVELG